MLREEKPKSNGDTFTATTPTKPIPRRNHSFRLAAFQILLVTILFLFLASFSYENNFISKITTRFTYPPLKLRVRVVKRILVYTPFFNIKELIKPIPNYTKSCGCKVYGDCEITYDHGLFDKSDLVIFHARDMPDDVGSIHKRRPRNQLWMHYIMECPYYTPPVHDLDQYFNLTSSYRLGSDLQWLYTLHTKHQKFDVIRNITLPNYAENKTKLIAWAVSHCGTRRDQLAKKLNDNGVRIDNYGRCNFPFTNQVKGKPPYHQYKFYFAAESQLCNDYITEKYWNTSFLNNANMVPVVFGGSNYSNPAIAIPGSYIDALQFSTAKKLAKYLLLLDKNDALYNMYFSWKREWSLKEDTTMPPRLKDCIPYVCDLCEKLHANKWNFRKKPLINSIDRKTECGPSEKFFDEWIKR